MIDLVDFEHQQVDIGWESGLKFLGKLLGYPDSPPNNKGKRIKLHFEERERSKILKKLTVEERETLKEKILELASRPEGVRTDQIMSATGCHKNSVYYVTRKIMESDNSFTKEAGIVRGFRCASKCWIFKLKKKEE